MKEYAPVVFMAVVVALDMFRHFRTQARFEAMSARLDACSRRIELLSSTVESHIRGRNP